MANSVVKITDSMLDDKLLLLVGEDGTVTPDRETVQTYLNTKGGPTNIQVMHINKTDGKGIDLSIDNVTYLPDADEQDLTLKETREMQVVPVHPKEPNMEEVARNLFNIRLDHDYTPLGSPTRPDTPQHEEDELAKTLSLLEGETPLLAPIKTNTSAALDPTPIGKRTAKTTVVKATRPKVAKKLPDYDDDEDFEDEAEDLEDLDEDDSDFELEEELKPKAKRASRSRTKSDSGKLKPVKQTPKKELKLEIPKPVPKEEPKVETPKTELKTPDTPSADKKSPVKKDKKTPKPIPDDFALFSTPDIIRRVGGKEVDTSPSKPAKINQEMRSKSTSESSSSPTKSNRTSLDSRRTSSENKQKERRPSVDKPKKVDYKKPLDLNSLDGDLLDPNTGADNLDFVPNSMMDATGLDLDPTLLDNINNDIISEDILYQVAQSLVGNTELQNVIDKGINEGKLVLDPSLTMQDNVLQNTPPAIQEPPSQPATAPPTPPTPKSGTQIVRPDGRIVTIPPIERPTTRSRNKRKSDDTPKAKPSLFKPTHKPLDDEHVSGNELDSSGEEEAEGEDDPNKLWCICNQPHNNRFMICCDTCEEWYHGKCVGINKAMGQAMESEGKEWICLFCRDPSLRRPQAAARRVRKASRNSRASTDSMDSSKKQVSEPGTPTTPSAAATGSVPCVVCQKPSRKNSIFCSEACILVQAQNVERTVVFERSTGQMLSGNKAPSAANLDQWLKEHPTYEAVKASGKVVTSKSGNFTQSKLKLVKNPETEGGVSLAIENKAGTIGVLKHAARHNVNVKTKAGPFKIISKQVPTNAQQPVQKKVPGQTSSPKPQQNVSTPTKVKVLNAATIKAIAKTPTSILKDKPMPIKTPKARQQEQAVTPKQPENIRDNVKKTLFEQLTNRLKLVEDLKLTEDEVRAISSDIESQLYKCFGDTGQKYRNKYRSLMFNIKDVKNQTLWRRICEKSINPYELVRLSPDDLASQELAMWREREAKHQLDMIKKSELELLNCNRQYVLKTHKGEEVFEDERLKNKIDNTDVIKTLTEPTPEPASETGKSTTAGVVDTKDKKSSVSKHSHKDKDKDKERKSSRDSRRRSSSRDRNRRRSRSREHSRKDKKRSRSRDKHRKSSHKSSKHKKDHQLVTSKLDAKSKEILDKLVVNKIVPPLEDRLWKHVPQEDIVPAESDSDHEPTSTVTIPTPPRSSEPDEFAQNSQSSSGDVKPSPPTTATSNNDNSKSENKDKEAEDASSPPSTPNKPISPEIWRGSISMVDVAQISITAHVVSGDCAGLGKELSPTLDIVGRISPDTVWDYISKMRCSNSKMISLVRLMATNVEEKMPYLALYSYLSSRTRLGVVKSTNKAVKDFYILPLAPQKPIPQALLPLSGPGFEEPRPAVLLGIIVRDKRKRPAIEPTVHVPAVKRGRVETPPLVAPSRSYTPPPVKKDPRLSKLPLPDIAASGNEDDEPYSPGDSDPDSSSLPVDTTASTVYQTNKYGKATIPGLGSPPILPSDQMDLQRQMEELNKKIEMQKSEINSISQNIVTASGSEIGTSALANIALPSNLQQILDSIKTIEAATSDTPELIITPPVSEPSADLTIPLMIPKSFPKRITTPPTNKDLSSDTIPLVLPGKSKVKSLSMGSPVLDSDAKPTSVLSTLSEEDLIRKAAEMLGEAPISDSKRASTSSPQQLPKRSKMDTSLPPVPGLEDELL